MQVKIRKHQVGERREDPKWLKAVEVLNKAKTFAQWIEAVVPVLRLPRYQKYDAVEFDRTTGKVYKARWQIDGDSVLPRLAYARSNYYSGSWLNPTLKLRTYLNNELEEMLKSRARPRILRVSTGPTDDDAHYLVMYAAHEHFGGSHNESATTVPMLSITLCDSPEFY